MARPLATAPRAFASDAADLATRLDPRRPVEAIDAVLGACLGAAAAREPGDLRAWTVARRLDALLAVRLAASGDPEPVPLDCPACGDRFEVTIDLAACRPADLPERVVFDVDGHRFEARCPTGNDQARWQSARASRATAAASLLDLDEAPDDAVVTALEAALAAQDPGRSLRIRVDCPACRAPADSAIDLEAHLLQAFAAEQRRWLREIAAVARAYPWSEREIAAMPSWRRRFYLELADEPAMLR